MMGFSSQIYHSSIQQSVLRLVRFLAMAILFGIYAWPFPQYALAEEPWSLSNDQRRAFLHYYSPIILKQADEQHDKDKLHGHDWITNFNFDRDGNFSNNRRNWKKEKYKFVNEGAHQDWQIRPTLYTAVIEFMNEGKKSLILLYHVYHAMQGERKKNIHDWERIELRLDNIDPQGPNHGESIRYHVLTAHKKHTARLRGHGDLHYVDKVDAPKTIEGKHLLVWQARWRGGNLVARKGEIRFVERNALNSKSARTKVSKYPTKKSFHYIFVDQDAIGTPEFLGATSIKQENARALASGKRYKKDVKTKNAKRITYELQDLADVFPTHWVYVNGPDMKNTNWAGKSTFVDLEQELTSNITGTPIAVPAGVQEFLTKSLIRNDPAPRQGYPQKHWFWGTYRWGQDGHWTDKAYSDRKQVWPQHDYFAHIGWDSDPGDRVLGEWLPQGWHLAENGGFDGRWTPLFPD